MTLDEEYDSFVAMVLSRPLIDLKIHNHAWHHVHPRCVGGAKDGLVIAVTHQEHFNLHHLLTKMERYKNNLNYEKLVSAAWRMAHRNEVLVDAEQYAELKIKGGQIQSRRQTGKKQSKQQVARRVKAITGKKRTESQKDKLKGPKSEEHKKKLRKPKPPRTAEHSKNQSLAKKGKKNPGVSKALKGRKRPDISVNLTGRKQDPNIVSKRSKSNAGKKRTTEQRKRISIGRTGSKNKNARTIENRLKISAGMAGVNKGRKKIVRADGTFYYKYPNRNNGEE